MKAHVVKGIVFAVVLLLAAQFCKAASGTAGWSIGRLPFLRVAFVLRPWSALDVVSSRIMYSP